MQTILIKTLHLITSTVLILFFVFSPAITPPASAGGLDGRATLGMQITQQAELAVSAVANTATAASNAAIAGFGLNDFTKEFVLDGLAFAVAKNMVSQMTQSLLNWINSGFQGSPAFIGDLDQVLLNALDQTAGEFIQGLGGIGEFICSPFQLDVQAALSINYAQARSGMPSGPTAPSCSLSDIGNNMENFLAGFSEGGLQEWLTVTSNPQNTPYGAYLAAEASLNVRLKNAAGQEIEIASWGDGFLSKKICEGIEGSSGRGDCRISTPGKVISEALTFQLSTGPRALIEADEINEIIGALINQLVLGAVQGMNGLLGLTSGTGYTDYSYDPSGNSTTPYIDAAVSQEVGGNTTQAIQQIQAQRATEANFVRLIDETIVRANALLGATTAPTTGTTTSPSGTTTIAELTFDEIAAIQQGTQPTSTISPAAIQAVIADASSYRPQAISNAAAIDTLLTQIEDPNTTQTERQSLIASFFNAQIAGQLTDAAFVETRRVEWNRTLDGQ